jgi:peptidoglycan/LPS O-acetylase OafA/YrhL
MTDFQPHTAGSRYRADIDGLRAIAVIPVVLFHYNIAPFTGGFVGVDVFFVISGYLITGLIWGEMRERRFSILSFYERRIRRIFPALFAVLAATAIAGTFLLFPHTLVRYAISLLATAGFISNFHFWGEAGYWAAEAVEKPLLHTWSLAVEEQFYLLFPGLLYLLRAQPSAKVVWVLGAVLALSLALSIVGVYYAPISTFYLLPSRLWELLIGGVLAVGRFPAPASALARNALAALGLALIAWSVVTLNAASLFPGTNALAPCVGAALIIYAGSGELGAVNAALGSRVPVFIGLISYSLYLWHWPIYVFAQAVLPNGLNWSETALAIAASFGLAILSWRYVELPFRGRASRISRKSLFVMAGSAVAAALLAGTALRAADGLPQRFDAATRTILAEADDREQPGPHCFDRSAAQVAKTGLCKIGAPNVQPSFVLWGDSHADAMLPAVAQAALRQGKAGLLAAHGHCVPLIGVNFPDRKCRPFNDAVARIALGKGIDTVLLDAIWAPASGETPLDLGRDGQVADPAKLAAKRDRKRAAFASGLADTVKTLRAAGKTVIIIGPVPEFRHSVPTDLAKMRVWGGHWEIAPTRAMFLAREAYVFSVFDALAKSSQVKVVRPDSILCPDVRCVVMLNGRPLYRDTSHLSVVGARLLTPLFDPLR